MQMVLQFGLAKRHFLRPLEEREKGTGSALVITRCLRCSSEKFAVEKYIYGCKKTKKLES